MRRRPGDAADRGKITEEETILVQHGIAALHVRRS
jgi:hypothetical protein